MWIVEQQIAWSGVSIQLIKGDVHSVYVATHKDVKNLKKVC